MTGRVRLASAYVLLLYVTMHLLNHAFGLVSLRVLEASREWFMYIWQNPIGQLVLYGAVLTHFSLAMWSVYRRRALRLSSWEWTQLALGASIVPLAAAHVVGTRVAYDWFGVHSN
jgi:adenylate cyclase